MSLPGQRAVRFDGGGESERDCLMMVKGAAQERERVLAIIARAERKRRLGGMRGWTAETFLFWLAGQVRGACPPQRPSHGQPYKAVPGPVSPPDDPPSVDPAEWGR